MQKGSMSKSMKQNLCAANTICQSSQILLNGHAVFVLKVLAVTQSSARTVTTGDSRVRMRVEKAAWKNFHSLLPVLTGISILLKITGHASYNACICSVLVYASETWAVKLDDIHTMSYTPIVFLGEYVMLVQLKKMLKYCKILNYMDSVFMVDIFNYSSFLTNWFTISWFNPK